MSVERTLAVLFKAFIYTVLFKALICTVLSKAFIYTVISLFEAFINSDQSSFCLQWSVKLLQYIHSDQSSLYICIYIVISQAMISLLKL